MREKAIAEYGLAGIKFKMELPVSHPPGQPQENYFAADDIVRFEREIARWIVANGLRTPETFRFLRKKSKRSGEQLAEILGVAGKEIISRWENGKRPFDVATWNAVADLAIDAIEGRDDTAARLRALQEARKPKTVTLKAS